jgi:hypothetical protein
MRMARSVARLTGGVNAVPVDMSLAVSDEKTQVGTHCSIFSDHRRQRQREALRILSALFYATIMFVRQYRLGGKDVAAGP